MDVTELNGLNQVKLNPDQMELITSLLLDQLIGVEITEEDFSSLLASYADFIKGLRVGSHITDSNFESRLTVIKDIVKDDPHYLNIVNTILSIWKKSFS
jgi:hypothetical protein